MNKYFLPLQSNNESVLNKLSLKKLKSIAKKQGLKNYSQYNSKTKSHLIKLILKEELNAGDWFNKLNRLNIKIVINVISPETRNEYCKKSSRTNVIKYFFILPQISFERNIEINFKIIQQKLQI
jgi:hypothetical protein